jgi:rhodanese-related sulfurtransferase
LTTASRPRIALLVALAVTASMYVAWALPQATDTTTQISADDLLDRLARGEALLLVDVRSEEEFADGHVPGAINIPYGDVAARLDEIVAHGEVEVVLYCRSGRRASIAADTLRDNGVDRLLHLSGDMRGWQARQLPVVKGPDA